MTMPKCDACDSPAEYRDNPENRDFAEGLLFCAKHAEEFMEELADDLDADNARNRAKARQRASAMAEGRAEFEKRLLAAVDAVYAKDFSRSLPPVLLRVATA